MNVLDNNASNPRKRIPFLQIGVVFLLFIGLIYINKYSNTQAPKIVPKGFKQITSVLEVLKITQYNDQLLIGSIDGVFKFDLEGNQIDAKNLIPDLGFDVKYVRDIYVDKDNSLWIGHDKGLTHIQDGKAFTYKKTDGLSSNQINCITRFKNNDLWVGTASGLCVYSMGKWTALDMKDYLASDVKCILEDSFGGRWVGSSISITGGISYFKDNKWQYFSTKNGLIHASINSIFQDSDGTVWAGTGFLDRGGAIQFEIDNDTWKIKKTLRRSTGFPGDKVCKIFNNNGILWFGYEYEGLAFNKNNVWHTFDKSNGMVGNEVREIFKDSKNNIWLGSPEGIVRIDGNIVFE